MSHNAAFLLILGVQMAFSLTTVFYCAKSGNPHFRVMNYSCMGVAMVALFINSFFNPT